MCISFIGTTQSLHVEASSNRTDIYKRLKQKSSLSIWNAYGYAVGWADTQQICRKTCNTTPYREGSWEKGPPADCEIAPCVTTAQWAVSYDLVTLLWGSSINLTLLSRTTLPWWDTGCSYRASQHTKALGLWLAGQRVKKPQAGMTFASQLVWNFILTLSMWGNISSLHGTEWFQSTV